MNEMEQQARSRYLANIASMVQSAPPKNVPWNSWRDSFLNIISGQWLTDYDYAFAETKRQELFAKDLQMQAERQQFHNTIVELNLAAAAAQVTIENANNSIIELSNQNSALYARIYELEHPEGSD